MDNSARMYRRFLDGDKDALVEIIRNHKDGLILYLNSLVKDIGTAEELAEDTFVKLIVKRPRFSEKSTFKTFLYAIARNTAVDHIRKNAVRASIPLNALYDYSDEEDLEQDYIQEEQKILLHRALGKLSADYRQVLYLTFFEDFSNAETATIMHKTKRQIENLLYRAKQALKAQLEQEGFCYEGL